MTELRARGAAPPAHARSWLSLQRTLGLTGLQNGVISLVHGPGLISAAIALDRALEATHAPAS